MHSSWCSCDTVRLRSENYVEQFLFCRPLAKHTTGKEMFKNVHSRNISFRGLTACLFFADGASAMMRTEKVL